MLAKELEGKWAILTMDLWDKVFIDLVESGYIEFMDNDFGTFHFGRVYANRGRVRKRILKYAKHWLMLESIGTALTPTHQDSWPHPEVAHYWPITSLPIQSCYQSFAAYDRLYDPIF